MLSTQKEENNHALSGTLSQALLCQKMRTKRPQPGTLPWPAAPALPSNLPPPSSSPADPGTTPEALTEALPTLKCARRHTLPLLPLPCPCRPSPHLASSCSPGPCAARPAPPPAGARPQCCPRLYGHAVLPPWLQRLAAAPAHAPVPVLFLQNGQLPAPAAPPAASMRTALGVRSGGGVCMRMQVLACTCVHRCDVFVHVCTHAGVGASVCVRPSTCCCSCCCLM